MKKNNVGKGLMIVGSLRKAGITTYMKQGQLITRVSYSNQKRSNTRSQFIARQKMRHTIALWKMLKFCDVMFTQRSTAYQNFASLANRLPAVFVERLHMDQASFLMPGIPVSDGSLPTIQLQLGEVNGMPALLTNLTNDECTYRVKFRLYTAVQTLENGFMPRVRFNMHEVRWSEMTLVDGHMVLVGEEFADEMRGWALVRVIDDRCSPQGIVTRCTLYEQYTTDEALQTAAKSYGGLTKTPFL
jgi:hypothetical protein